MEMQERFRVEADPERVWSLLSDVTAVASCLPGVELEGGDDGAYNGRMRVSFGPTTAVFSGQAEIVYDHRGRTATITARGRDARGASRAAASVLVVASAVDGGCAIDVTGELDVGGPLAQFARTGGIHVTRALLVDFAACLTDRAAADDFSPLALGTNEPESVPARRPVASSSASRSTPAAVGGLGLLWRVLRSWFRERVLRNKSDPTSRRTR